MEEFFDNYYQEGGWQLDDFGASAYWKRVEYLSELVKSVGKDMQILDLGCGKGEVSRYLSEENTVYGLDISSIALKAAIEYMDAAVAGDAEKLPFDGQVFDLVLFSESIYYLDDPIVSLKEIRRVLKPHGVLVLTCGTANAPSLWPMLLVLKVLNRTIRIHTTNGAHWKTERYTTLKLRKLLKSAGFRIERQIGYFFHIPLLKKERFIPLMIKLGVFLPMFSSYVFFFARPNHRLHRFTREKQ
jgi:ubiquinone/menaquinone biosynthesis C-methylase UbiE